jgi:hypothetical protein
MTDLVHAIAEETATLAVDRPASAPADAPTTESGTTPGATDV